MTLSPEVLASLRDVPLDWELLPLNGNKQPVDPADGLIQKDWPSCATDLEGITAAGASPHVKAVGVLLGPQSGGVLAVDFDGEASCQKFQEVFRHKPTDLPSTITVTSGRHQRGCLFLSLIHI